MDLRPRTSKRQFDLNCSHSSFQGLKAFLFPSWNLQTCLYWDPLSGKSVCHAEHLFRILFLANLVLEKNYASLERVFLFSSFLHISEEAYSFPEKSIVVQFLYILFSYRIPEVFQGKFFHCHLFVCVQLLKTFLFLPPFMNFLMVWAPPSSSIVETFLARWII